CPFLNSQTQTANPICAQSNSCARSDFRCTQPLRTTLRRVPSWKENRLSPSSTTIFPVSATSLSVVSSRLLMNYFSQREHDGLSPRYVYALKSDLTRFKNSFHTNIGSVTSSAIEDWLMAQGVGARTRNNLRTSIVTLFHFARARGYLAKGQPT